MTGLSACRIQAAGRCPGRMMRDDPGVAAVPCAGRKPETAHDGALRLRDYRAISDGPDHDALRWRRPSADTRIRRYAGGRNVR